MFFITAEEEERLKTRFKLSDFELLWLEMYLKIHDFSNFEDFKNCLADLDRNGKLEFLKNSFLFSQNKIGEIPYE